MPEDRALLRSTEGTVSATVNGKLSLLHKGDEVYVGRDDQVSVNDRSLGRLTFRGGGYTIVCAGAKLTVGQLSSAGRRPAEPSGALELTSGRLLADTAGTSRAYSPLNLDIANDGGHLVNAGAARFAVAGQDITVAAGSVAFDGTPLPVIGGDLRCGDSGIGIIPSPSPSPSPTDSPSDEPSESASDSPSPTASPTSSPTPRPTRTPTPTPTPTSTMTNSPTPSPTRTTPPPPPNNPPVIRWANGGDRAVGSIDTSYNGQGCHQQRVTILYEVTVSDDHDTAETLVVQVHWRGKLFTGAKRMGIRSTVFYATLGPFNFSATNGQADFFNIYITATDSGKNTTTLSGKGVTLLSCTIIG